MDCADLTLEHGAPFEVSSTAARCRFTKWHAGRCPTSASRRISGAELMLSHDNHVTRQSGIASSTLSSQLRTAPARDHSLLRRSVRGIDAIVFNGGIGVAHAARPRRRLSLACVPRRGIEFRRNRELKRRLRSLAG